MNKEELEKRIRELNKKLNLLKNNRGDYYFQIKQIEEKVEFLETFYDALYSEI